MTVSDIPAELQAAIARVDELSAAVRADEIKLDSLDKSPSKNPDAAWVRERRREDLVDHLETLRASLGAAEAAAKVQWDRMGAYERIQAARARYDAIAPSLVHAVDAILVSLFEAGSATADERREVDALNQLDGLGWGDNQHRAATPDLGPARLGRIRAELEGFRSTLEPAVRREKTAA